MSDRSLGDFARMVQLDPVDAARKLISSLPAKAGAQAAAEFVRALERFELERDGWTPHDWKVSREPRIAGGLPRREILEVQKSYTAFRSLAPDAPEALGSWSIVRPWVEPLQPNGEWGSFE